MWNDKHRCERVLDCCYRVERMQKAQVLRSPNTYRHRHEELEHNETDSRGIDESTTSQDEVGECLLAGIAGLEALMHALVIPGPEATSRVIHDAPNKGPVGVFSRKKNSMLSNSYEENNCQLR